MNNRTGELILNAIEQWEKNGPRILVDFDGTLAQFDKWRGRHHIGKPIPGALCFLRLVEYLDWKILIWSTRKTGIKSWLKEAGFGHIPVNRIPKGWNPPIPCGPMPYYDIQLNDRCWPYPGQAGKFWTPDLSCQNLNPKAYCELIKHLEQHPLTLDTGKIHRKPYQANRRHLWRLRDKADVALSSGWKWWWQRPRKDT